MLTHVREISLNTNESFVNVSQSQSRAVLKETVPMAVLLDNATNCIWQAFSALQQDSSHVVHKSKLKVLTANIGTLLDVYGVEKGLEHFRSTSFLSFNQFKYYLQKEVFSSLPSKLPLSELREYEGKISEVCWMICNRKFTERPGKIFGDGNDYHLFRIFCTLGELIHDGNEEAYQVVMHPSEVCYVAQLLANSLGSNWDEDDFTSLSISMGNFRLTPFIAVLESRCLPKIKDAPAIKEAVTNIYQMIAEDVLKKGVLSKRGYIFPTMKEYWFVLRPTELVYYKNRSEKEKCGVLAIEPGSKVEAKTGFKLLLHTPERCFELGTRDHISRLQWLSALQLAVEHSGNSQSYQRQQAAKRRLQRQGRVQEMLRAKAQLQLERTARQVAEGQAKELEAVVKEEAKKLGELEELKVKLERLLEEETQAKRDEEIVRALQARVLAEEWEKREELERLQEEQRLLLEEERGKRIEYEELQRKKEQELKSAEERLAQLELERKTLDEQLKIAHDKMKLSEDKKEVLEARLYEVAPQLREGERVRRAHSFMPSSKERPVMLQIRAATLKRPNKN